MSTKIDYLKNSWGITELILIARFLQVKDTDHGYFNHFINPTNKKRIFYPDFGTQPLIDSRISFFQPNKDNRLVDQNYYKVTLEHTPNPPGKNNPYSLRIKEFKELNQIKINKYLASEINNLLDENSIAENKFFGRYKIVNDKFALFEDVMSGTEGNLLMKNGERLSVFVSPKANLLNGKHYSFSIEDNPGKRPSTIISTISKLNKDPYQEYIRLRYERLNNPEANKMIANLMREIGKGMYSSKQRMIFELLQNADDAPAKDRVEFHIDVSGDYFFVMHDGMPFNKDDVEAITSAAESTKRNDNKKTGYKGIGFKSVFTDSSEVWIKSGGYQFAFQRNNSLFNDFDQFYFSAERYQKYPDLLSEDKEKYKNQKIKFNGSTDIPWQVIPIWQKDLPNEFIDSNFASFNNPVQFALKLGSNNIKDYLSAVDNITRKPQFLLFLRNTSKFRSPKNGITISKNEDHVVELIKDKRGFNKEVLYYHKRIFDTIPVSDNAFKLNDINLKRKSKKNDYDEITYYFTDFEGNEIETIPPKLASVDETSIVFGISINDNSISAEQGYINKIPKYSSLFTFLPMEDTRFQLPFLVNADFVPSSDRQKIQGDNLWNIYIMAKIAEKHIETLHFYANEFISNPEPHKQYLSLLLRDLIPVDDTAQKTIDQYNNKYYDGISSVPTIVNDKSEIQLISKTIIDHSGLSELFSNELFYEIIGHDKCLPHSNLDTKYLSDYKYLNIESLSFKSLVDLLSKEHYNLIGVEIAKIYSEKEDDLLEWLDRVAYIDISKFCNIPFIEHDGYLWSMDALINEDEVWIIDNKTEIIEPILKAIGYKTVNFDLKKYNHIENYLNTINNYINDKTEAYNRLADDTNIASLTPEQKNELIEFFQKSGFMAGIGEKKYFEELYLYTDANDIARPLRQLLNNAEITEATSLHSFSLNTKEFENLPEVLKKELISKENSFTKFILNPDLFDTWSQQFNSVNINTYVGELLKIYKWKAEDIEIPQSKWSAIPWFYIDDNTRFVGSEKVYYPESFLKLSDENYKTITDTLSRCKLKTCASKECGALVVAFELKTNTSKITNWSAISNLSTEQANTLLDWMEEDGNYNDFFQNYTLSKNEEDTYSIQVANALLFDSSDHELNNYISSHSEVKSLFTGLDSNLCNKDRNKLGLLQGDKLLHAIISTQKFEQDLATFLPSELSLKQLQYFVNNLSAFNLSTGIEYNTTSPEYIILNNILKRIEDADNVPEELLELTKKLRSKLFINKLSINHFDLNDKVPFGKGDNKYELKLSDILKEYKGESDVLNDIIESFGVLKHKSKLRKFILKTRRMLLSEICSKIENEDTPYYTVVQYIFIQLYKKHVATSHWKKPRYDEYWKAQGRMDIVHENYLKLLEKLLEINFTELTNFSFHNLNLMHCVDERSALTSEKLPAWLSDWVKDSPVKKLDFLSKLGYNAANSSIVKLREAIILIPYNRATVVRYYDEIKGNIQLLWNTIHWLANYSSEIITNNIQLIQDINNYVSIKPDGLTSITIPIIKSISSNSNRSYELKQVNIKEKPYYLDINTQYAKETFHAIRKEDAESIFIDNYCGKKQKHYSIRHIELVSKLDSDKLKANSILWNEPFYKKWDYYHKFPIYIYNGDEIPYQRVYNDIVINEFTNDLKQKDGESYYVSKRLKSSLLDNLPESFPAIYLQKLKDWHYRTLQDPTLLDDDSFDYNEKIDKILQSRLGLTPDTQKQENGSAKTHAIYYLEKLGFNIDNINDNGVAISGVKRNDGSEVKCIVHSAKGGLLYINKGHWEMMANNNTYLVAIYPGNEPRLFKEREELLADELADNVLFRIPNDEQTEVIDDVFDNLESDSHLILVTSEKMKKDLFGKIKGGSSIKQEQEVAIGGENILIS